MTTPSRPTRMRIALRTARAVIVRVALLALVWVVFAGWDAAYGGYGIVSVAAATALSLAMFPLATARERALPFRWRRVAAVLTLPLWFIGKSIVGGADVAWRAAKTPVDIEPAVVTAPCLLDAGNSREVALLMMNLMPGSMVQRVTDDGTVELHTLSESLRPHEQWESLQRRVAAAFGENVR